MFSNIREALGAYKRELEEYKAWSEKLLERYGGRERVERLASENSGFLYSRGDEREMENRNARLKGMATVLGLSSEEERAIDEEVGIVVES